MKAPQGDVQKHVARIAAGMPGASAAEIVAAAAKRLPAPAGRDTRMPRCGRALTRQIARHTLSVETVSGRIAMRKTVLAARRLAQRLRALSVGRFTLRDTYRRRWLPDADSAREAVSVLCWLEVLGPITRRTRGRPCVEYSVRPRKLVQALAIPIDPPTITDREDERAALEALGAEVIRNVRAGVLR